MKLIAIGDVHGRDTWKQIAEKEADFDKFVFVGDYFDNFPPFTSAKIIENFKEMLAFKQKHGDKVVLCIGNHDFQYMPQGEGEKYSGRDENTQFALDHLQGWTENVVAAYQYEDVLFTHAGLTNTWANHWGLPKFAAANAAYEINKLFAERPEAFRFYDGDTSRCGEDIHQSPFWVRPDALLTDMYPGIKQVVGHTHTDQVEVVEDQLVMLDTGRGKQEYLTIIDGVMNAGMLMSRSEQRRRAELSRKD